MRLLVDVFACGIPKGQPRPRAFARNGKARVYDPGTAEAWKGAVALAVGPRAPVTGPVRVDLAFAMPRPKAHLDSRGRIKDSAPGYHTGKPDADNLAKGCLDALTTMRVWQDDAQVASLRVTKRYDEGGSWGCAITVFALDEVGHGTADQSL